ncbi:MAG: glycosyltransferase family 4 protein, partial [Planctomycetes bacterium]|nr:glycosyltransferase family 4 protein [Planctomycetota bacterium]
DEANRAGLEDWDFWLRCATAGHWGTTIPEYLDWYRRRETHSDRWDNWDSGSRQKEFLKELQRLYPHLKGDGFPKIPVRYSEPYEDVPVDLPCANKLAKNKPRLLMLVPWMTMGGSDKFSLDLLERLTKRGWEVTIAATRDGDNGWHHEFAKHTPDVFIARNLVTKSDYPRLLQYLIESRQVDAVLTTHSCLGYQLLPFLRSRCPDVAYLDYCHIEEADWKNGGYPRFGVGYQEVLDLNVVSSEHLKRWMVERGGDPERIEVCYTGVDPTVWKPDAKARESFREQIGVGQEEVMVLFAGRLHSQKQPRVLARTIVALAERGLEFRAVIAGDGEERGAFDSIISGSAAANRVLMLGAISQDDMKRAMPAADIFFLPSKWEGIALSLYEAMSCGVAFVGAAVGGQRELVDSSCGCLIERSDEDREVEEYTELLDKLIRDRAYRERLSRAGRERAETFSLDAMAEQMIACIDRAKKLANDEPRMAISPGLGRESAVAAIESTRLETLADSLWSERHNASGAVPGTTSVSRSPSQWRVVKRVKRMIKKRLPKLR